MQKFIDLNKKIDVGLRSQITTFYRFIERKHQHRTKEHFPLPLAEVVGEHMCSTWGKALTVISSVSEGVFANATAAPFIDWQVCKALRFPKQLLLQRR